MAGEFVLKPIEFQKEVDGYEDENAKIADIKYTLESDGVKMDGYDKLKECKEAMERLVEKLTEYGKRDVRNLQNIKSAWMNLDEDMGDLILMQQIFGE